MIDQGPARAPASSAGRARGGAHDPPPGEGDAGIYVHLPFCVVRCSYCDFYSLVDHDELAPAYVSALGREIRAFGGVTGYRPLIRSVYIGGGTPTHLPPGSVPEILEAIGDGFPLARQAEITVEANPESAPPETLRELREAGANRLSLGVQSFQAELLRMMGRPHGPQDAARAVASAREAGFDNVGIDLIYGLPGQSLADWEDDLDRATRLGTEHLSAYLLETDKETPLARSIGSGRLEEPAREAVEALYRLTEARLPGLGYARYEVSNWARPGRESIHNLGYWSDRPYVGFGASSHSYFLGKRWACRMSAAGYVSAVARQEPTREALDDGAMPVRLAEAIVTALRLAGGADFDAIGRRYGVDLWGRHGSDLEDLARRGWAVVEPPRVRLTIEGILWSLDALAPFVEAPGAVGGSRPQAGRAS